MDLGTLAIEWRLVVALFVAVAPALLFLGLVRGLESMRDGLVSDGIVDRETDRTLRQRGVLTSMKNGVRNLGTADETVRCPECGGTELANTGHCTNCLGPLAADP